MMKEDAPQIILIHDAIHCMTLRRTRAFFFAAFLRFAGISPPYALLTGPKLESKQRSTQCYHLLAGKARTITQRRN